MITPAQETLHPARSEAGGQGCAAPLADLFNESN